MRAAADESSPRITRQSSVPSGPSLLKDQSNCYAARGRGPGPRMSVSGQDRPIFAPARSRSQGPLSDQVADAPNPRGQCRGEKGNLRRRVTRLVAGAGPRERYLSRMLRFAFAVVLALATALLLLPASSVA